MRRIVVTEFMTLDGVMEDPGGAEKTERGGWAFLFQRGPEGDKFKSDELFASDAQLLGRVTYLEFAEAWPARTGEFADKFNNMDKYVVSNTLKETKWQNSHIISGDVFAEIAKLKTGEGGDILVAGSQMLVNGLLEHNLVDELRLMVYPIVLGQGKQLFNGSSQSFELVEARPVGTQGVITLVYQPKKLD